MAMRIDSIHGDNVLLDKRRTVVSWSCRRSGGVSISSKPIKNGSSIHFEIEGTGRITLGMVQTEPSLYSQSELADLTDSSEFIFLTEIRVSKRKTVMTLILDEKGRKATVRLEDTDQAVDIDKSRPSWFAADIKFGTVQLRIVNEVTFSGREVHIHPEMTFHPKVHGNNLQFFGSMTKTSLVVSNPAAVCCTERALFPGEMVKLRVMPIKTGNRLPTKYHIIVGVYSARASVLMTRDPESFSVVSRGRTLDRWLPVETFEENECWGEILCQITRSGFILFTSATGKTDSQTLRHIDVQKGVWIVLELFRVVVSVESSPVLTDSSSQPSDFEVKSTDSSSQLLEIRDRASSDVTTTSNSRKQVLESLGDRRKSCPAVPPRPTEPKASTASPTPASSDLYDYDYLPMVSVSRHTESPALHNIVQRVRSIEENMNYLRRTGSEEDFNKAYSVLQGVLSRVKENKAVYIAEAIKEHYPRLIKEISLFPLCDYLYHFKIIEANEMRRLTSNTDEARADLLAILSKREVPQEELANAFEQSHQHELLTLLIQVPEVDSDTHL